MTSRFKIGFMQGRLSPLVDGKIQAFPWNSWEGEFSLAQQLGFSIMEWTLDHESIIENPLLSRQGQQDINDLKSRYNIDIPSLTADFIMQKPYYQYDGRERFALLDIIKKVLLACSKVGIIILVFPLVDNGSIKTLVEKTKLFDGLIELEPVLDELGITVCFESDLDPGSLKEFIDELNPAHFGINYDIGNSAATGYDPVEEIGLYGKRILNLHVKDRKLSGTTVPLGEGNAKLELVFRELAKAGYKGNYILQTARAVDNDHAGVLKKYKAMSESFLSKVYG